jgi:hypothetical protein
MEYDKRMESTHIYGVVVKNTFYSNRMEFKVNQDNGIYSMDMSQDEFRETIAPANIEDARKFFGKASKIVIVRGISFHDGLIPENPIAYNKIPLKVIDATYDEFEEVEVAIVRGKVCYFLQTVSTAKAYPLLDLKERLEAKDVWVKTKLVQKSHNIDDIKGVTPEMRIVYTFHLLEKKKKEMEEPVNAIKTIMTNSGAEVHSVKKVNRGYEVVWSGSGWKMNTLLDNNYRVLEAGFCVSGHDRTQSASSVVKLLEDYVSDGHSYVHHTRVVR